MQRRDNYPCVRLPHIPTMSCSAPEGLRCTREPENGRIWETSGLRAPLRALWVPSAWAQNAISGEAIRLLPGPKVRDIRSSCQIPVPRSNHSNGRRQVGRRKDSGSGREEGSNARRVTGDETSRAPRRRANLVCVANCGEGAFDSVELHVRDDVDKLLDIFITQTSLYLAAFAIDNRTCLIKLSRTLPNTRGSTSSLPH